MGSFIMRKKGSATTYNKSAYSIRTAQTESGTVSPEKSLEIRKKMCDGKDFYKNVKKELISTEIELNNSRIGC